MADITTDNILVMNQGKSPLVSYNFMLRVEGIYDLPCKSVRAFSRELEYDYIQEGGLNDYVHMLRKPISKPFTLEVERYVGVDYVDPLPEGADLILPVILMVSRYPTQSSYIPFVCARTYVFTGCTVMKKVFGDLVGDRSDLLVETTTIAYREFSIIDAPWSEAALSNVAAPPEHSDTGKSSLETMLNEIDTLIEKAQASEKTAANQITNIPTLKTNLSTALSDLNKLKTDIDASLTALYAEIESLENAPAGTDPAEGTNTSTGTATDSPAAKKRADAQKLEALKEKTLKVSTEIEQANNLATGSNDSPNRLDEAQQSHTKAADYLTKAATFQSSAKQAKELWEAQSPINQAKSNAQSCINCCNTVNKQIQFFEGKLKTSNELLAEAQPLLSPASAKE